MNNEPLPICLDKKSGGDFFDEIVIGRFTRISFHRTLRIPEDGREYPLPAGLGRFPIHRVEDYAEKVPVEWLQQGGFFIPLYQKEALFLQFEGAKWHPNVAKIYVGKINAITGNPYSEKLSKNQQDYVVIPNQRWLDGICSGDGLVKQFVAMPLGQGYTIEGQITDEERFGGFQIVVFDSVKERFPDRDPDVDALIRESESEWDTALRAAPLPESCKSMGIAAGGSVKQQIYKDFYGVDSWDTGKKRSLTIHLVNSLAYKAITGVEPPPSPITAAEYQRAKIPWYSHYDETAPTIKPPSILKRILGVSSIERKRGISSNDEIIVFIQRALQVHRIRTPDKTEASTDFRKRAKESQRHKWWESAVREISYVIDLNVDVTADDYALRSCCNFHLGRFRDGSIDASLGLKKDGSCAEALTWRARCRKSLGEHQKLSEDADRLLMLPETELFGLEMKAEASLLAGNYIEAFNNAMLLKSRSPENKRAHQIITEANIRLFGHDLKENHV